ncbi:HEAT repeat domain-containing protein [Pyxidicoccus xibeiensis]|uniref:HEAT repeat domain-containing protein n=1 Tax=Pyxidicoccus xibeiensis TaxID=2906759 RepID=UPI0020A7D18E|nr:HEAT repeat domain-containing protein [Pyxidicoccus xibeiensis]MCP3140569.1 HEAT repeat domain-containing protein [Pyxidicoccus xibeiensis]
MSPALLLVVLLATGQQGGTGTKDCWMSCQRHVQDSATRARACAACLPAGRVDAWVAAVGSMRPVPREPLVSARKDADWRVRWAAVRAEARARGVSERQQLAEWVVGTPSASASELTACLTAARAAAEAGQSSADFLKAAGPRGLEAAGRVWARRNAIREALELEVYAEELSVRGAALAHLSGFLGRRPARLVLEALESRPESTDTIPATALKVVAERKRTSVGRLLLEEAKPADEARINRLFAVYSRELEALQPELAAPVALQRRKAVQALRLYGPLARKELERALEDADRWVRMDAARWLAETDGLTLGAAAERRLETKDAAVARPWLEAMVREKGCAAFFLGVARDTQQPPALRGDALTYLAECDEGARERAVRLAPLLHDSQALVRAGAVRALGTLSSRRTEVAEATTRALEDPAPEVVAAALEVVAGQRQSTRGDEAAGLLGSEHPAVRAAAARALEHIGRPPHVKELAVCLREDPVAAVRVAAAQALGYIGGPHAAAALSDAATRDTDTHVQHVSRESLKRLGFGPGSRL